MQNYPNPFNPVTTIRYDLPKPELVTLKVYDLLGQEVRTLVNERQNAGENSVFWDGQNQLGNVVGSGIYIYQFKSGGYVQGRKMLLIR